MKPDDEQQQREVSERSPNGFRNEVFVVVASSRAPRFASANPPQARSPHELGKRGSAEHLHAPELLPQLPQPQHREP